MAFESDEARIDALFAAATQDAVEAPAEPAVVEQAATETTPTPTVEFEGTTETVETAEDSFKGFDTALLEQLPQDLREKVEAERKSIQSNATRKLQEAAELRRQFDGLDPKLAREATQYVQSLADPEFLIQAHEAISTELERLGYTRQQAQSAASEQLQQQAEVEFEEDGEVPPHIANRLNHLESRVAEQDQERFETRLLNEALKQETAIRQAHPNYTDADMAIVLKLGWETGGNLIQANEAYKQIRDHVAKSLLQTKANVPAALSPPPVGGAVQEPKVKARSLDEAHRNALARLAAIEDN